MSRCTDLGSAEHKVLRALDSEGRGVKQRKARVTPAQIAQEASLPSPRVLTCLNELIHLGYVDRADEGTYLIYVRCTCKKTDSSIPAGRGSAGDSAGTGFASASPADAASAYALRRTGCGEKSKNPFDQGFRGLTSTKRVKPRLNEMPIEKWNSYHLALHFKRSLHKASIQQDVPLPPGSVNLEALAGQFARWRRDGYSNPVIREMAEIFCGDLSRWRQSSGQYWWKTFINKRTKLFTEASARLDRKTLKGEDWTNVRQLKDVDWLS